MILSMMSRTSAFVVVAIHIGLPLCDALGELGGILVVIEHCVVEVLLGGEVAENDGFGDAGRGGDFLGGSAAEPFAGEKVERRFDKLAAAVACRESKGRGAGIVHALIVSQYLLTVKGEDGIVLGCWGSLGSEGDRILL